MVNSHLGNVLGQYRIENIINIEKEKIKLTKIENTIVSNTNQDAVEKYGIKLIKIGIRRINYPSIVVESVYERMQAEREKEARKYRAEGMEESAKIESETNLEVEKIKSEAYKKAEIIKGTGDKKANSIFTKNLKKDPELYDFLRSLDLYKKVIDDKSSLIISTESDFLKYLDNK